MGRDKALLHLDGVPMWQRQRNLLVAAGATQIFLSVRPEQAWAHGATNFAGLLYDAITNGGPLVGITAGLERMTQPWLAVLAVDLPKMTAEWFTALMADGKPGIGAVGKRGGNFEPLAAIYPRELMSLAWEALARGEYSLQTLLAKAVAAGLMRVREISASEADWFANWNEPDLSSG